MRCNAAFQVRKKEEEKTQKSTILCFVCLGFLKMIVVIRLLTGVEPTEWMSRALIILYEAIGDPKLDEEEKLLAIDIIGRLAHIPTGDIF